MAATVAIANHAPHSGNRAELFEPYDLGIETFGVLRSGGAEHPKRRALALTVGVFDLGDGVGGVVGLGHGAQLVVLACVDEVRQGDPVEAMRVIARRFYIDGARVLRLDEAFEVELSVGADGTSFVVTSGDETLVVPLLHVEVACRLPPERGRVGASASAMLHCAWPKGVFPRTQEQ